jgi:hypothetical protein
MRTGRSARLLLATTLACAALGAQEVLHFRFEEGCGSEVIGLAPGSARGTLTAQGAAAGSGRLTGAFGQGLSGSIPGQTSVRVDTGWVPDAPTGDFSFAMWLRNHQGNPTTIPFGYLFGATGGQLRMYIGSTGRVTLDGFPAVAVTNASLTADLNAGWTHLACVVDSGSVEATFYINGVPEQPAFFGAPAWISGSNFTIGARDDSGSSPSPLDIDEFLWIDGLWNANQVQALAAAPRAGVGAFDSNTGPGCGAPGSLQLTAIGMPTLGNSTFALRAAPASASLVVLAVGLDRCALGGVAPLPLDIGTVFAPLAGCPLLVDPVVTIAAAGAGPLVAPLPIPAVLPGLPTVFAQAFGIDLSTLAAASSEGIAAHPGF